MPRPPRLQVAGGRYHVTARGNRRQDIFSNDGDRVLFLVILGEVIKRFSWRLIAYCLMPNHFHLLIETPRPNLSTGMQRLNSQYAQWFNHLHGLSGHLFQGRFHAVLIEREEHFLELPRYILLNPERAGLCTDALEWPWSSYAATVGQASIPGFLDVDWLLTFFGGDRRQARAAFHLFVAAGRRR